MTPFLVRRFASATLTIWAVFTLSFFIIRSAPGGPFDLEREPAPDIKAAIEARYDLDLPLWKQYVQQGWLWLTLDPGPSLRQPDHDVATILSQGFPVSVLLGGWALVIGILAGLALGILSAWRPGSWIDRSVVLFASLGISLPMYLIAGLLIMTFSFHWNLLPPAGWTSLASLVLPMTCLALAPAAQVARLTRSGLLETSSEDFARTAKAKGRSPLSILILHCLRPASIPVASTLGPTAAALLTGSLVVEQIFAIPGIGMHFVQGAMNRDYPLVLGVVLLYTVLLQVLTLIGDLLIMWLDPRGSDMR